MLYAYFDPSALVKRYHQEKGTKLFNQLFEEFQSSPAERVGITSVWSIAEMVAVLIRIPFHLVILSAAKTFP